MDSFVIFFPFGKGDFQQIMENDGNGCNIVQVIGDLLALELESVTHFQHVQSFDHENQARRGHSCQFLKEKTQPKTKMFEAPNWWLVDVFPFPPGGIETRRGMFQ